MNNNKLLIATNVTHVIMFMSRYIRALLLFNLQVLSPANVHVMSTIKLSSTFPFHPKTGSISQSMHTQSENITTHINIPFSLRW